VRNGSWGAGGGGEGITLYLRRVARAGPGEVNPSAPCPASTTSAGASASAGVLVSALRDCLNLDPIYLLTDKPSLTDSDGA